MMHTDNNLYSFQHCWYIWNFRFVCEEKKQIFNFQKCKEVRICGR